MANASGNDGIEVPFSAAGLAQMHKDIDSLISKINKVPKQVTVTVNRVIQTNGQPTGSRGKAAFNPDASTSFDAADMAAKHARMLNLPIGPLQRQKKAQDDLNKAIAYGTKLQQADAQIALNRANKAVAAALRPPPSMGQRFMSALLTSRVGYQNGNVSFHPLVGKLISAVAGGGGAAGGGFGGAAGGGMAAGGAGAAAVAGPALAAALAVAGLAIAAVKGASVLREFSKAYYMGGGSTAQTAGLAGIGYATGQTASSVAGQSRELAIRLAQDPAAMILARQYGVRADMLAGDPLHAKMNTAENYMKLARGILNDPNERRAMRAARGTGMEDVMNMRDMSPAIRNALLSGNAAGMTKEGRTAAADLQGRLGLLTQSFDRLMVSLSPFIPIVTSGVDSLTWFFEKLRVGAQLIGLFPIALWEGLKKMLGMKNNFAEVGTAIEKALGKGPQDEHSRAMREHSGEMRQWRAGMYGGGERARGALPGNFHAYFNQSLDPNTMRLGGFAL